MNQNLDHTIQFLKNLDSENKNLKIKINELELYIKNLTNDLDNLSKVSIISNLDKQLKEKMCIISSLEKVNSELQKKISSKNVNELKEKNTRILLLENEIEKNNSAYELLKINNTKLQDEINELKLYIIKDNDSNELNNNSNESHNNSNGLNNNSNGSHNNTNKELHNNTNKESHNDANKELHNNTNKESHNDANKELHNDANKELHNNANKESHNDSDEESDNKYPIIFKKKNYLVDNDNNVYNINDKANIIIGKLIKNKVKFL